MNKLILIILIAGAAIYYVGDESSKEYRIVGQWSDNGEKTVQSMIDSGKNISSEAARKLIPSLSNSTLIITEKTLGMSFRTNPDPSLNLTPIPYDVVAKTSDSVTIRFEERPGTKIQKTYHFTENGQCIYENHNSYKIFSCKSN